MKNKFEILTELAKDYLRISREMSYIVSEYEKDVIDRLDAIRRFNQDPKLIIVELFKIQEELSIIKYRFNYNFNVFLNSFIYEFDRQDDESISYLINKIRSDYSFLIELE